jgi:hypothetical protein
MATEKPAASARGSARRSAFPRLEAVADAANSLQRVVAERPVDLLPQVADVHVDDVRTVLVGGVPRTLDQLVTGDRLAGTALSFAAEFFASESSAPIL